MAIFVCNSFQVYTISGVTASRRGPTVPGSGPYMRSVLGGLTATSCHAMRANREQLYNKPRLSKPEEFAARERRQSRSLCKVSKYERSFSSAFVSWSVFRVSASASVLPSLLKRPYLVPPAPGPGCLGRTTHHTCYGRVTRASPYCAKKRHDEFSPDRHSSDARVACF